MPDTYSDALVFFGATGDLAYKKIFPALQALIKRGQLDQPIIGVAKAGWTLEQMRRRAQDSVETHGDLDRDAFARLCGLLRYVDGDYNDPATFAAVRRELDDVELRYPAEHYVLVDDKLRILTAVKRVWDRRVTTVFPRQGHYAHNPEALATNPPADVTVECIGDLLAHDLNALIAAAASARDPAPTRTS